MVHTLNTTTFKKHAEADDGLDKERRRLDAGVRVNKPELAVASDSRQGCTIDESEHVSCRGP